MKIIISAFGTRGDVQPAVVLAIELQKRDHDVTLLISQGMETLPIVYGIPYLIYKGDSAKEQFGKLGGSFKAGSEILKRVKDHMIVQANELPEICKDADVLLGNCLDPFASSVAEYCNIPFLRIALTPIFGGENRPTTIPLQSLPLWGNKIMWKIGISMWELMFKPQINKARKILDLAPIKNYNNYIQSSPTILCLDDDLAPPAPQWPSNVTYTGYPFLNVREDLSEDLKEFIEDGELPVYIGFGSMGNDDPLAITKIIVEAVEKAGVRVIVNKGWANLGGVDLNKNILEIDNIPHSALFEHVGGVVHHGGAGTIHTAAKAGCPQLIIPHITDQFYYGESVSLNELGPKPIPFNKINVHRLTKGLIELNNSKFKKSAITFAQKIHNDGSVKTIDAIENYVSSFSAKRN